MELDKTVVDLIGDPLMHMVRNAVDHGIEVPDAHARAGKPAAASRCAPADPGNIYIEIEDDGKGLDRDADPRKGRRARLRRRPRCATRRSATLIFQPGLLDGAQVTDLSGRGVGMDVVRRNIELLRGKIESREHRPARAQPSPCGCR